MSERMTMSVLSGQELRLARPQLASLLAAAVNAGASVNFVLPFDQADGERFYESVEQHVGQGGRVVIVARVADGTIVGTVHLVIDTPPNQPHRADVTKLLVHPEARRRGIGSALMAAVEQAAIAHQRTLLVLDTVTGTPADLLYRRLGWSFVGEIPGFALSVDGRPEPTSVFFKEL
jgi:ribosomal protein S18 acetylase RimI-like enzyme